MKKHTRFFMATVAIGVLTPAVVSPLVVEAAEPDSLVYSIDGKQVKVSYSDYEDVLFGENKELENLLKDQSPNALGVGNDFIHYSDFVDLLFDEPNKNPYELIDIALADKDKLVSDETKSNYETIIGFENGKPIYSNSESPDSFEVVDIQ